MQVLLVEDDVAVALVVKTVLQREGWDVHQVEDAESALAWDGTADLLVTDYNLPGVLNGLLLARKLREQNALLAVVLMSGDFEEGQLIGESVAVLPKPFRRNALLDAIDQARNAIRA